VYNYNRFQACRFGLEGMVVHPKSYAQMSLADDILATLRLLQPQAMALNCVAALRHLEHAVQDGSDANFLRRAFDRHGHVEGMVDAALQRFCHKDGPG
jgi:carboxylate-amine ligase